MISARNPRFVSIFKGLFNLILTQFTIDFNWLRRPCKLDVTISDCLCTGKTFDLKMVHTSSCCSNCRLPPSPLPCPCIKFILVFLSFSYSLNIDYSLEFWFCQHVPSQKGTILLAAVLQDPPIIFQNILIYSFIYDLTCVCNLDSWRKINCGTLHKVHMNEMKVLGIVLRLWYNWMESMTSIDIRDQQPLLSVMNDQPYYYVCF